MKILRLTVIAMAAAVGCAVGCQSGSGCGGTNINAGSNVPPTTCGNGTTAINGVCQLTNPVNSQ